MIVRLVKLEIQEQHIDEFKRLTENEKDGILAFQGCSFLEILQDTHNRHVFFSHSHWQSEEDLNRYRCSDFFRGNWTQVKQWFAAEPLAWSLDRTV